MLRLSGRFCGGLDYTTTEDYDPPNAEWRDFTPLGSEVQTEVDVNNVGHYRHRNAAQQAAWKKGKPDA